MTVTALPLDLADTRPHPARFTPGMIPMFAAMLAQHLGPTGRVLDPFAGTGRIHDLDAYGYETTGVEIESCWANYHPRTRIGDATALPFDADTFDAVCSSPAYANRMGDTYTDDTDRITYTAAKGSPLRPNNAGGMNWGERYRDLHRRAWAEAVRVLRPGGVLIVNVKDHYRSGTWQDVVGWHLAQLVALDLAVLAVRPFPTPGNGYGANGALRVPAEIVAALRLPEGNPR